MAKHATWKYVWNGERVSQALSKATFVSLNQAGAVVRMIAQRSIKAGKKASSPGQPPRTRKKRLPHAIIYFVDKQKRFVIIGPSADLISNVGAAHEFGGTFRQRHYDARPFMKPALEKSIPRLPACWSGSVQ